MKFYWSIASIPEFQTLTNRERTAIWLRCKKEGTWAWEAIVLAAFLVVLSVLSGVAIAAVIPPANDALLFLRFAALAGGVLVGVLAGWQVEVRVVLPLIRKVLSNRCAACGYDLRYSTGRCPECGTPP